MTDYAGLKAEIALPKYNGMTDAQIAASLNTTIAVQVDADAMAAFAILQRSPTGDWSKVVDRSRQTLTGGPILAPINWLEPIAPLDEAEPRAAPANNDPLIIAAINFVATYTSGRTVLHTSNAADLQQLSNQLQAFQNAGDITSVSANQVLALSHQNTTRTQQLGFDPKLHDMTQEIAAARKWTP